MDRDRDLQITIKPDCANAPKKQLLRDLNIAYARSDVDAILKLFTDDISWHIVGEFEMRGKERVREVLEQMRDVVVCELIIDSIITHGREGAVSGTVIPQHGNPVAFCDVCQFQSAAGKKVKAMKSYTVEFRREG